MLKVADSHELQAATLAMKRLPREVKSIVGSQMRVEFNPVWGGLVRERTSGMQNRVLAAGAKIKAGNPPVLQAATSTRKIGRGIRPASMYAGYEFGADRNAYSKYSRRSKLGKVHTVSRRTMKHLPQRHRTGYAVYPAAAEIAPRVASFWVQSIIRTVYTAFEL